MFVVYHLLYLVLVVWLAGRFVLLESRYRRWRRDYFRSLARVIERELSRPLADLLLFGRLQGGGVVTADVSDGGFVFE